MRRGVVIAVLMFVALGLSGCSARPYKRVDLSSNLGQGALARYESEWQAMRAAGHADGAARLEHTNWWLSGLLLYYRRASVMRVPGDGGPTYHVTSGEGFGPLCILYNSSTMATYNASGERLNGMAMHGVIAGHVAMIHKNDALLADGTKQEAFSLGLIHHVINIHKMDGHTYVSFLTNPNPIGVELGGGHSGHGSHAGHHVGH